MVLKKKIIAVVIIVSMSFLKKYISIRNSKKVTLIINIINNNMVESGHFFSLDSI